MLDWCLCRAGYKARSRLDSLNQAHGDRCPSCEALGDVTSSRHPLAMSSLTDAVEAAASSPSPLASAALASDSAEAVGKYLHNSYCTMVWIIFNRLSISSCDTICVKSHRQTIYSLFRCVCCHVAFLTATALTDNSYGWYCNHPRLNCLQIMPSLLLLLCISHIWPWFIPQYKL